jgi:hypothetical protein
MNRPPAAPQWLQRARRGGENRQRCSGSARRRAGALKTSRVRVFRTRPLSPVAPPGAISDRPASAEFVIGNPDSKPRGAGSAGDLQAPLTCAAVGASIGPEAVHRHDHAEQHHREVDAERDRLIGQLEREIVRADRAEELLANVIQQAQPAAQQPGEEAPSRRRTRP